MKKIELTENEKRDIFAYIEADKPLPEKYRWLLFEDKKQVELVWNGKTTEVSKTVLPFQTIEVVDEPRAENTKETKKEEQLMLFECDDRGGRLPDGPTSSSGEITSLFSRASRVARSAKRSKKRVGSSSST